MSEKMPKLRGTLAPKESAPKLRGTLAPKEKALEEESSTPKLRGTLATKGAEDTAPLETRGTAISKVEFPNIDSLKTLGGRRFIQRDGGREVVFEGIKTREGRTAIAKLRTPDGAPMDVRLSPGAEMFYNAITNEGGAWRLLPEKG